MSITKETRDIMKLLIRNRFDALKGQEFYNTAPQLINIAKEMGYNDLAEEMQKDYEFVKLG